uniref:Uncharacterized protein n=1 Tax=Chaetophora sp. FACHB-2423 TaxID=2725789 RepID=A0A6H1XDX4_9CHLO|nr:hypothetical protein [Chaetophora sp. FACHB-2423]
MKYFLITTCSKLFNLPRKKLSKKKLAVFSSFLCKGLAISSPLHKKSFFSSFSSPGKTKWENEKAKLFLSSLFLSWKRKKSCRQRCSLPYLFVKNHFCLTVLFFFIS